MRGVRHLLRRPKNDAKGSHPPRTGLGEGDGELAGRAKAATGGGEGEGVAATIFYSRTIDLHEDNSHSTQYQLVRHTSGAKVHAHC